MLRLDPFQTFQSSGSLGDTVGTGATVRRMRSARGRDGGAIRQRCLRQCTCPDGEVQLIATTTATTANMAPPAWPRVVPCGQPNHHTCSRPSAHRDHHAKVFVASSDWRHSLTVWLPTDSLFPSSTTNRRDRRRRASPTVSRMDSRLQALAFTTYSGSFWKKLFHMVGIWQPPIAARNSQQLAFEDLTIVNWQNNHANEENMLIYIGKHGRQTDHLQLL